MWLDPPREGLDSDGALEGTDRDTPQVVQQTRHPVLGEVLDVVGLGVQSELEIVVAHRNAHRDTRIEAPIAQHVDGREVLGETQRILQPERDDGGAELDAAGPDGGRSQNRDRRGDPELQMTMTYPDRVEAEILGAFDHAQSFQMAVPRMVFGESADGQEAEFVERFTAAWHTRSVAPQASGPQACSVGRDDAGIPVERLLAGTPQRSGAVVVSVDVNETVALGHLRGGR